MYATGDFSFIKDTSRRADLEDAYTAVTMSNAWDFFRTAAPPEDTGYMFWDAPELIAIGKNMKHSDLHSGASFALIMRAMQSIALVGWDAWVTGQLKASNAEAFKVAQVKVIKSIQDEPIDNGIHAAWLGRKEKHAREMTEESMGEILMVRPKEDLAEEYMKYSIAHDIQSAMKLA
jgi:hypothetical protein